ncbi:MAG: sugar phosphate isomerase/epimerase [Acidobacteria bacterium]|nr:sugar phosphate isomerase/epimerase [Acidobacteriota bacterium]
MISRRKMLALAAAAPFCSALKSSAGTPGRAQAAQTAAASKSYPRMGGTPTAFMARFMAARGGSTPFDMIEHCHSIGLAGVQMNPPSVDPEAIRQFRRQLEKYNMHLVCDPRLPKQDSEVSAFEEQVKAYKEAGATAFHAAMTGRRYEDYDRLEPFRQMFESCKKQIELAEPVLRKYKIRLGIENHKGWRSAEQASWLKQLGSEWVGVCLDFGNNLSLCEDPMDTARVLAPYACFAHIKDNAVQEYEDGFLLSEVPLGEGIIDLKQIVQMLRAVDPNMIMDLEMITRDPLKIPVFTSKYWATFDDDYSPLPGRDLAKVLALVKKNPPKAPLPRTSGLSREEQVKLEDECNLKCIAYARQHLNL